MRRRVMRLCGHSVVAATDAWGNGSISSVRRSCERPAELIHLKGRVGIVFVPDLIYRLALFLAHIKPIRAVYHHAVHFSDVFISMNDTLWHNNGHRVFRADKKRHSAVECR